MLTRLVILLIFCTTAYGPGLYAASQGSIGVALRMLGHQILLQQNDSFTRVLPVTKENNRYRMGFEKPLSFNPENWVQLTDSIMKRAQLPLAYRLEVEQCHTHEIVYSYELNPQANYQLIPCRGRQLPLDCYVLYFTSLADSSVTTTGAFTPPKPHKSNNKYFLGVFGLIAISAVGFWWYYRKKRNVTKASLGQFTLDPHQMALVNQGKTTPLSGKEWELLLLLKAHANQTLNRETILNQVWGDEGDYIGRTLDVFISKLRKKLEHDPQLKLINIRGVGYKLSVEGNRGKQF